MIQWGHSTPHCKNVETEGTKNVSNKFLFEEGKNYGVCYCFVGIYNHLLNDRKFGMTHNILATKIMPTLIPLAVCPGLTIDQVSLLLPLSISSLLSTILLSVCV